MTDTTISLCLVNFLRVLPRQIRSQLLLQLRKKQRKRNRSPSLHPAVRFLPHGTLVAVQRGHLDHIAPHPFLHPLLRVQPASLVVNLAAVAIIPLLYLLRFLPALPHLPRFVLLTLLPRSIPVHPLRAALTQTERPI